jgi:glycogen debranching enzyme
MADASPKVTLVRATAIARRGPLERVHQRRRKPGGASTAIFIGCGLPGADRAHRRKMDQLSNSLVVKAENVFLVTPRDGGVPLDERHAFGLWYRDCRFLSGYGLLLNGEPPVLLQASDALGTTAIHDLTNPDLELAPGVRLPAQSLSLRCERVVDARGGLRERLELANHHREPVRLDLEVVLAADFQPMLVTRGLVASHERAVHVEVDEGAVRFSVRGRDGVLRTTTAEPSVEPAGIELSSARAAVRFDIDLPAGGSRELTIRLTAAEIGEGTAGVVTPRSPPDGTRVRSDQELFDRVLARSLQDLDMLRSQLAESSYYSAGVPWYATLFGRDGLISAMQMLAFDSDVAAETLRLLGTLLGRAVDDSRDEQPGRVLHELRVGEPAALGETPFARYYGSVDATPLWLSLLADHADWSGNLDLFRELRPQVDAALGWMERYGDLDGDGLIEYLCRAPDGLVNQGWRDSWDGVPYADGMPLEPPIALVEVQGYAIRALRGVARLFELDGDGAQGERLRERADRLRLELDRFWLPDMATYAIGLDRGKRPGSELTSNPGHLLWAGAISPERALSVRGVLMSEAMFSGWGVRTLAAGHPGYNPIGYHTGSVWPHDTALVACGLREYGFDDDFNTLFDALLEASSQFGDYRLPELFGGHARTPGEGPVPYPVACRPQAWAAGSIPYLLTTGLGLSADGLSGRLRVVRPALPSWLTRLEVEGLRVAGASVDLRFERSVDGVVLVDTRVDGDVELVVEGAGQAQVA